jgi:hypothetical protein
LGKKEGLENSWTRHQKNHVLLKEGLEAMGIHFLVNEADCQSSLFMQRSHFIFPLNLKPKKGDQLVAFLGFKGIVY